MGLKPCKIPTSEIKIMTAVADARATAARCSAPSRPAMMVSTVAEPMMERFATKMGLASLKRAATLMSGGVSRVGRVFSGASEVFVSALEDMVNLRNSTGLFLKEIT